MPKFYSLFSSSKGNCAYIENESGGILIDASPSLKALMCSIDEHGIDIENIKAVLITHEHSDHIGALKMLIKKHSIPVYASPTVIAYLEEKGHLLPTDEKRSIKIGEKIDICGFSVEPFHTSHDALESYGFTIQCGAGKLGFATDLGIMNGDILSMLKECDTVYIESNYDESMLLGGSYNRLLKMRILGERGHLSNYDCASSVKSLVENGKTRRFILAHLSEENNTPAVAEKEVVSVLENAGYKNGNDYLLYVSSKTGLPYPILF